MAVMVKEGQGRDRGRQYQRHLIFNTALKNQHSDSATSTGLSFPELYKTCCVANFSLEIPGTGTPLELTQLKPAGSDLLYFLCQHQKSEYCSGAGQELEAGPEKVAIWQALHDFHSMTILRGSVVE